MDVQLPLKNDGGDKDYTDFYDLDILGKAVVSLGTRSSVATIPTNMDVPRRRGYPKMYLKW